MNRWLAHWKRLRRDRLNLSCLMGRALLRLALMQSVQLRGPFWAGFRAGLIGHVKAKQGQTRFGCGVQSVAPEEMRRVE